MNRKVGTISTEHLHKPWGSDSEPPRKDSHWTPQSSMTVGFLLSLTGLRLIWTPWSIFSSEGFLWFCFVLTCGTRPHTLSNFQKILGAPRDSLENLLCSNGAKHGCSLQERKCKLQCDSVPELQTAAAQAKQQRVNEACPCTRWMLRG